MENKVADQILASGPWVGRSVPHEGSHAGVTGTICYLDDLPRFRNELAVELETCSQAHARITFLDVTTAAVIPGIAAVLTAADVPGDNRFGALVHDEELLASSECRYIAQPIVALAGETPARRSSLPEVPSKSSSSHCRPFSRSNRRSRPESSSAVRGEFAG